MCWIDQQFLGTITETISVFVMLFFLKKLSNKHKMGAVIQILKGSVFHYSLISYCQKFKNSKESMIYYLSTFCCRWRTDRKICRSCTCCYFVYTFSSSFSGCSLCFCKVRFIYPCYSWLENTQKCFKEELKQSYKWN